MPKLTDSQLIVLSKAAARDDGAAVTPRGMGKAPTAKVGSSLIARKLMREIRSKPGMPIWREMDGKNFSLVITRTGRNAIGVADDATASHHSVPVYSWPESDHDWNAVPSQIRLRCRRATSTRQS